MIKFYDGDLLKSGCDIIAHQVNEYGAMGAGLAAQIKAAYPEAYVKYLELCNRIKAYGQVQLVESNGTTIANCFSQKDWKTDYNLLTLCVGQLYRYTVNLSDELNRRITVGIPYKFGSGIAHGDWDTVYECFRKFFEANGDVELQIWKLV